MCRMLYTETSEPRGSSTAIAKYALKYWSFDNPHGTGMAFVDDQNAIQMVKGIYGPKKMFKKHFINTTRLMGHVRRATDGTVSVNNAHPFVSCDGRSVFMHNGIIFNWKPLKEKLVARGHKFTSETDSEVMLHLAEEVGPSKLMAALREENVSGMANWIWMMPHKTVAFSDGSLHLVRNELGLKVALFSDLAWAEPGFFKNPKHLSPGTLVIIRSTRQNVVRTKEVGTINAGSYYSRGAVEASTARVAELIAAADKEATAAAARASREDGGLRTDRAVGFVDDFRDGRRTTTDEVPWFAPGDLFCKKCNVVYDNTTTGYCSICHGELMDVSEMM